MLNASFALQLTELYDRSLVSRYGKNLFWVLFDLLQIDLLKSMKCLIMWGMQSIINLFLACQYICGDDNLLYMHLAHSIDALGFQEFAIIPLALLDSWEPF